MSKNSLDNSYNISSNIIDNSLNNLQEDGSEINFNNFSDSSNSLIKQNQNNNLNNTTCVQTNIKTASRLVPKSYGSEIANTTYMNENDDSSNSITNDLGIEEKNKVNSLSFWITIICSVLAITQAICLSFGVDLCVNIIVDVCAVVLSILVGLGVLKYKSKSKISSNEIADEINKELNKKND